jgi:hypothetical protein
MASFMLFLVRDVMLVLTDALTTHKAVAQVEHHYVGLALIVVVVGVEVQRRRVSIGMVRSVREVEHHAPLKHHLKLVVEEAA